MILTVFVCTLLSSSCFAVGSTSQKCKESWCIRISMFPSSGRHRFVVQSTGSEIDLWDELLVHFQDEPLQEFERDGRIQFVSGDIGFFWIGATFGVSKDKGRTWSLTNFSKDSVHGRNHGVTDISSVLINEKGVGVITFRQHPLVREQPTFTTEDFGITWEEHGKAREARNSNLIGFASRESIWRFGVRPAIRP